MGYHHQGKSSVPQAWEFEARRRAPGRRLKVVNFGRPGEGSEFAVGAALDSLAYHPDLIFLFVGENEFVPANILRSGVRFAIERRVLSPALGRELWRRAGREPVLSVPDFRFFTWNHILKFAESRRGALRRGFRRRMSRLIRRLPSGTVLVVVEPSLNMVWGPLWHDDLEKLWIDPEDPAACFFVSGILAEDAQQWTKAVDHHANAFKRSASFADAAFRCAGALDRLNRVDEANAYFLQALDAGPLPRRVLLSPGDPLRRKPRVRFVPALDLLSKGHPRSRVDFSQTEDDIHLRPESEWFLAETLVGLPEVVALLGAGSSPAGWNAYRREAGLDDAFEFRTAVSVAKYHAGRQTAEPFLEQAARLFPHRPELAETVRVHKIISTRRRGLMDWLTHNWRSRGFSSEGPSFQGN